MAEIIYDLMCKGRKIIQNKDGYCFTTDSVLLANFVKLKKTDRAVEFCSGSGVVSVLVQAKTDCKDISLVEVQPQLADMCNRTIELNDLKGVLKVFNTSFQDWAEQNKESLDVVFCNPPYMSNSASEDKNLSYEVRVARHETLMNLEDLAVATKKVLKYGGKFFMVHKAQRFDEILSCFSKHNLAIKNVVFCHPKIDNQASFALFEGIKGGKKGLKVLPPLILNNEDGSVSMAVNDIYNRDI